MKKPLNLDIAVELWDRVRSSLWFVPGLMAAGALVLAIGTPFIETVAPNAWLKKLPWIFSGKPDGARAVLSTIATSIITLAGVVFSMTIVSLQLASSQFGPRLLRTFLRDRGNQIVLGTFVGIFLYCVLLLPGIGSHGEGSYVPQIAVTFAVVLALVGLAMLVYFIDHVAQSIHADAVIFSVAAEMDEVVDRLFPERTGEGADDAACDDATSAVMQGASAEINAQGSGYLRFISSETILDTAADRDLLVRVDVVPGQFVHDGDQLLTVWPRSAVDDDAIARLRGAFTLGAHRTTLQDPRFVFAQLTEMAVRALSPGINDPTTAIHCIDRIGSGLARVASRDIPAPYRRDANGNARAIVQSTDLPELLEITIEPIQRNAAQHFTVWVRLMTTLEAIVKRAHRDNDRDHLQQQANRLLERALKQFPTEAERSRLTAAHQSLCTTAIGR